jgi:Protein of unknown function (DUF3617)
MQKTCALLALTFCVAACSGGGDQSSDAADKTGDVAATQKSSPAFTVKPGLWETKVTFATVDAKGLPEAAKRQMIAAMGKGVTVKNCVTKEQSEKPGAEFFGSPNSSNCSIDKMDAADGKMALTLTCKPDAKAVISSSMTGEFSDDSYSMNVQQKTSGTPMGDLITTGKIDGKRLGDCPA